MAKKARSLVRRKRREDCDELELTAKKIPGKKNIVRTANAFIAEESRFASLAISLLCSVIFILSLFPIVVFLS
jgi:hypothetical protein